MALPGSTHNLWEISGEESGEGFIIQKWCDFRTDAIGISPDSIVKTVEIWKIANVYPKSHITSRSDGIHSSFFSTMNISGGENMTIAAGDHVLEEGACCTQALNFFCSRGTICIFQKNNKDADKKLPDFKLF